MGVKAADFGIYKAQAVLFTPGASVRNHKILAYLLSKWGDLFAGEPISLDLPAEALALGVPRVILKSEDSLTRLQVAHDRLDFFRHADNACSLDASQHLAQAIEIFNGYCKSMNIESTRVAAVVSRAADDDEPARTISRQFCREFWLDGPINRPTEFEIHALKSYQMGRTVSVNSWFRCKSGTLATGEEPNRTERRAVLVEQDLNTPNGEARAPSLSPDTVREFFALATDELDGTLGSYFPDPEALGR